MDEIEREKQRPGLGGDAERWVGTLLAQTRRARGVRQKDLARLLGMPQSQLSRIEANKADVRWSTLLQVARALQLEPVLVPLEALPAVRVVLKDLVAPVSRMPQNEEEL